MNKLIDWHFCVQKGMYFDELKITKDCSYFLSKTIKDSYWNYALFNDNVELDKLLIKNIESVFYAEDRVPCFYIVDEDTKLVEKLSAHGYDLLFEESFMVFQHKGVWDKNRDDLYVKRVNGDKEIIDFMNVFVSSYGGEKTPEQPYGELDKTYYDALLNSFSNAEKFYHYICYMGSQAVSIATLCFDNMKGGIYNVGTVPCFRGKGFGSAVTNACIHQWKQMNGDVLFLQTELGSSVEKWYYKMGFKQMFIGRGLGKEV